MADLPFRAGMLDSSSLSLPYTALKPGSTSTLPSVRKVSPSTVVTRVVFSYLAGGKNTAMNRWQIIVKIFCSASVRPDGITPVGMIAKWSEIFELSNTLGVFTTQLFLRAVSANLASGPSIFPRVAFTGAT